MKFLYIVSSPHGGSTLLSLVLGQHRLAANLGEVSFIPKLLAKHELCTCGEPLAECATWQAVFSTLAARSGVDLRRFPYGLFLGDAIKSKDGSGLIDTQYQTRRRRALAKIRGAIDTATLFVSPNEQTLKWLTLPSVAASIRNTIKIYESAATAWDKQLIVDASKLPRKAVHLYVNDPDRFRILHLVRDGRGVLASRMRYMNASRAAERWNHYHKLTRRILHRWVPASHRRVLRYEDFVAKPEENLRGLCEWLEIEYSADMLDFQEKQQPHSAGGNPARFSVSRGIGPADDRWRSVLSAQQLQCFERVAGPLNRELGYE